MRRLGQHFLRSLAVVKKIADAVAPKRGEIVIEIGGGHGELTHVLLESAAEAEAELIVIEKDPRLAGELRRRFPGLRLIEGDVRQKLAEVVGGLPPKKNFKLTGNLPYYLTGFLLRLISELERKPASCVFMMQKEVVERISARAPRMNKLAASVQFWAEPVVLLQAPRTLFSPPPKVDSAVIRLTCRPKTRGEEAYFRLVRALFAQPRQTILNNLSRGSKSADKLELTEAIRRAGLRPDSRPQEAGPQQIKILADKLGWEQGAWG